MEREDLVTQLDTYLDNSQHSDEAYEHVLEVLDAYEAYECEEIALRALANVVPIKRSVVKRRST